MYSSCRLAHIKEYIQFFALRWLFRIVTSPPHKATETHEMQCNKKKKKTEILHEII